MTVLDRSDDVVVGTLRIRSETDTPLVRAGIRSDVGRCELRPSGLAPQAVLVVRRIEAVIEGDPGPSAVTARRWVHDPRTGLDGALRSAVRPSRGPVTGSVNAVLFEDRAELLASYLVDLASRSARYHWWWDVLKSRLGLADSVPPVLKENARFAPATIASMTPSQTTMVLSRLSEPEALGVAVAVVEALGATDLVRMLQPPALVSPMPNRSVDPSRPPAHDLVSLTPGSEPPWAPLTPGQDAAADLSRSHQLLLGLCGVAATRPALLRSPAFVAGVERWRTLHPPAPARRRAPVLDPGHRRPTGAAGETPGPTGWSPAPSPPSAGNSTASTPSHADLASDGSSSPPHRRDRDGPDGDDTADATRTDTPGAATDWPVGAEPAGSGPTPHREPASADHRLPGTVTDLSGSFLLINLLRRLGLPERFEVDYRLDSAVGGWPLLEAVTRCLLRDPGHEIPGHEDDGLWLVLHELSGGFGARDVDDLVPTGVAFRAPDAWWPLIDLPSTARFDPLDLTATSASGLGGGLGEWLSAAMPFIEHAASVLVGVPTDQLVSEIVLRRGRVHLDRTHVDVILPLADVSLAVRRSGLDRNPGWTPEFGRVITFHFE